MRKLDIFQWFVASICLVWHIFKSLPPYVGFADSVLKPIPDNETRISYFLVDGLMQEPFLEDLEAGNLPTMAAMMKNGTYVHDAITSFPRYVSCMASR